MPSHVDILDQKEPLGRSFAGSMVLHISLAAAVVGYGVFQNSHKENWGDPNGGGMGAVPVSVVSIRLPTPTGPTNPVANDTESHVPEPKPTPKAPPKPRVKEADADAIALKSKTAKAAKQVAKEYSPPNKFREQQVDRPNQMTSTTGQQVSSNLYAMAGGGGVGIGTDSPLGTRFGYYATIIRNKVAQKWNTGGGPSGSPEFVVRFTLLRDGSVVPSSVKIVQGSGNGQLDLSAERAILDASPFGPLPPQFEQNQVDLELHFVLRR